MGATKQEARGETPDYHSTGGSGGGGGKPPLKQRLLAACERFYGSSTLSFSMVVAIVLPLFVDQLLVCVIALLNTTMISGFGTAAVSAVSMVDNLNNFVVNVFIAMATGCTVLVAQCCGKGDRHTANEVAAQAVGAAGYIALVLGGLIFAFAPQVVGALFGAAEQEILDQALVYLRGGALSYPLLAVIQGVLGALRGSGNTRVALVFSLIANLSYVVCNLLLLNVFGLGVLGMAISLVLTRGVTAVLALLYMVRSNNEFQSRVEHFLKLNMPLLRRLLYVSIPAALEQVFFHGGRMLTQIYIVSFGTMSIAANAVCTPLSTIVQVVGNAMALAIVPLAGQCMGAHKFKQAKTYIRRITLTAMVGMALTSLLMAPLLPLILSVFHLPPEAYEKAMNLCILFLIGIPLLWPTSFVPVAGLRAAGDVRFTSMAAMCCMWSVRVVLGYVLGIRLGWDVYGVWIAMILEWGVRSAVFLGRLRGKKWYLHRLV